MTLKRVAGCFLIALLSVTSFSNLVFAQPVSSSACPQNDVLCKIIDFDNSAVGGIHAISAPSLNDPDWTKPKTSPKVPVRVTVQYVVQTKGTVGSTLSSFASQVAETYADARGWSRMGVKFERVQSGGDFTIVLTQAALMTTFSATGCDSTYSCNVGNYVVINNDRWQTATAPWNERGGSLRDYRHMVVNHETGHWLGHSHRHCGGAGQPAPVMQQQSINLEGCTFNPWPLASELTSSRLGIY